MRKTGLLKTLALAAAVPALWALAPAAAMAGSTWGLKNCTVNCAGSVAGDPLISQTSAWSASATGGTGATFATAAMVTYGGGVGISTTGESTASPDHAIDNAGATEAMLLSFSSSVILRQLTIGWASQDSDFTVLRYTGASAPTIAGKSFSTLLSGGWSLVGNYLNKVANPNGADFNTTVDLGNAGNLSSSWWLISAYDSRYCTSGCSANDSGADYFKLMSVFGDKASPPSASVPEPASLALVAAALMGVGFSRGRRGRSGGGAAISG